MKERTFEEWTRMTTAELREATKEYDTPGHRLKNLKPTPEEAAAMRKFMRGRRNANLGGRPRVGQGAQRVLITVEGGLLKSADAFARKHKMSRSQLIATGLRLAMKQAG